MSEQAEATAKEDGGETQDDVNTESTQESQDGAKTQETTVDDSKSLVSGLDDGEALTFDFTTGERPEGFPEEYWDAENNAVNPQALYDSLQKEQKRVKDLRAKMGRGDHKPPEKADEYKFEPSEAAAPFIKDDDPLLGAARELALEHGMSQEQYAGFMSKMVDRMAEAAQDIAENGPQLTEEEQRQYIQEEIKKIGPNGPQVLRAVQSWSKELIAEGTFSEEDAQTMIEEGLTSARMVQLFNRLRARMGGSDIPTDNFDDGLPPDSEIANIVNKAYESKDEAKIRKAEELLEKRKKAGRPTLLQF